MMRPISAAAAAASLLTPTSHSEGRAHATIDAARSPLERVRQCPRLSGLWFDASRVVEFSGGSRPGPDAAIPNWVPTSCLQCLVLRSEPNRLPVCSTLHAIGAVNVFINLLFVSVVSFSTSSAGAAFFFVKSVYEAECSESNRLMFVPKGRALDSPSVTLLSGL